jgi:hypothetical protein
MISSRLNRVTKDPKEYEKDITDDSKGNLLQNNSSVSRIGASVGPKGSGNLSGLIKKGGSMGSKRKLTGSIKSISGKGRPKGKTNSVTKESILSNKSITASAKANDPIQSSAINKNLAFIQMSKASLVDVPEEPNTDRQSPIHPHKALDVAPPILSIESSTEKIGTLSMPTSKQLKDEILKTMENFYKTSENGFYDMADAKKILNDTLDRFEGGLQVEAGQLESKLRTQDNVDGPGRKGKSREMLGTEDIISLIQQVIPSKKEKKKELKLRPGQVQKKDKRREIIENNLTDMEIGGLVGKMFETLTSDVNPASDTVVKASHLREFVKNDVVSEIIKKKNTSRRTVIGSEQTMLIENKLDQLLKVHGANSEIKTEHMKSVVTEMTKFVEELENTRIETKIKNRSVIVDKLDKIVVKIFAL